MLFQLVLTNVFKSELFSCLPKVDHVIKSGKEPIISINVVVVIVDVVLKSSQSICFSRGLEDVKWYMKAIYFFYKPRTGVCNSLFEKFGIPNYNYLSKSR